MPEHKFKELYETKSKVQIKCLDGTKNFLRALKNGDCDVNGTEKNDETTFTFEEGKNDKVYIKTAHNTYIGTRYNGDVEQHANKDSEDDWELWDVTNRGTKEKPLYSFDINNLSISGCRDDIASCQSGMRDDCKWEIQGLMKKPDFAALGGGEGFGGWGTPLFGCMVDKNECLDIACCFPCAMSRQQEAVWGRADELNMMRLVQSCLFPVCTNLYVRHRVVNRYGLDEPRHLTFCIGWCCGGCSACQTHRELTIRGVWPGGTILHKEATDYKRME